MVWQRFEQFMNISDIFNVFIELNFYIWHNKQHILKFSMTVKSKNLYFF